MKLFSSDRRGDARVSRREQGLVRRYIAAVDANHSSNWSIFDDFFSEDFVAHNPPVPGVSLDREGMKQASEIFRNATPGTHEVTLQVAEEDLVVRLPVYQLVLTARATSITYSPYPEFSCRFPSA